MILIKKKKKKIRNQLHSCSLKKKILLHSSSLPKKLKPPKRLFRSCSFPPPTLPSPQPGVVLHAFKYTKQGVPYFKK